MSYEHPLHAEIVLGHVAVKNHKPIHNDTLKEIPGHKFIARGADYWRFPLTWTTMVCLAHSFPNLTLSDELSDWAHQRWAHIETILKLRTGEGDELVTDEMLDKFNDLVPSNRSLIHPVKRRYQAAGALLLATAERFLLLDEQGTGKMSEAALTFGLYPETLPALIVAPGSTLYTWQRELGVFGVDADVLDGEAAKRRKVFDKFDTERGVMVCSYSLLSKHSRVQGYGNIELSADHRTPKELNEIDWATVCADEVHRAKSAKAIQTRALWAVRERARFRWGMTGTPVEKSPMDFWAILHFIDEQAWPSSVGFRDRWVEFSPSIWGGFEIIGMRKDRADEWRDVSEHYWRRKMAEGLPPVDVEVRYCELKGKHLKAYTDMSKQLMAETGEDNVILFAQNHMVKAGRLKQMAQSFIETKVIGQDEEGNDIIEVTPIEPSPKLDLLMDTLPDEEGTPMILWFDSVKFMRRAQARLDAAGYSYTVIDGSMDAESRDKAVQSFQGGEVDMILLSISAASEGITLTRAPLAIHVERSWSFIEEEQLIYRNLRIGSEIHDSIRRLYLVTRNTIEEEQYEHLEEKRRTRDQVVSPLAVS